MFQPKATHRLRDLTIGIGAVLVLVLVIAAVSVISHTPSSNATALALKPAAAPSGYSTFVDTSDHFSIAVPKAWPKTDPTATRAAATIQRFEQSHVTVKAILGSAFSSALLSNIRLVAVDPTASGYVTVVVRPAPKITDSDLTSTANALPAEYKPLGATVVQTGIVQFAGHSALQLLVDLSVTTARRAREIVSQYQYIVASDNSIYIVSVGGAGPILSTMLSTFRVG